jgi:predicted dehydrogenase
MSKVRLGQIGVGTWGQVMLTAWTPNPKADVQAVCDVDGDRAKEIAEKYGISTYYDNVADLLAHPGLDAVGVATPDFAHREAVVAALDARKHVLVQKPMATTVDDCKAMVAAQKRSGCHLMIDYQHRWGIGFAEARKAVSSDSFGRVIHGRIRMSNTQRIPLDMLAWSGDSNVLWFLGTHTVDLLRYVIGSEVTRVFGTSKYGVLQAQGKNTPDYFQTMLEFENGVSIQMENSWVMPKGHFAGIELSMELYGANESVSVNQSPNNVITKATEAGMELPLDARSAVMARGKSIDHFIDALSEGFEPSVGANDGLMNTAVLVAIEKSVAEGRPVDISEVL